MLNENKICKREREEKLGAAKSGFLCVHRKRQDVQQNPDVSK